MTDPAAILEGPGTFADKCDALVGLVAALEAELAEAKDEIIKLRADIIWIAKDRDDNRQWAEDRATVAIEMADQRDQARQALAERTRELEAWKTNCREYGEQFERDEQERTEAWAAIRALSTPRTILGGAKECVWCGCRWLEGEEPPHGRACRIVEHAPAIARASQGKG